MLARVLLIAGLFAAGCEKTNHENIDKWTHTQKGPDKLKSSMLNESLDADLSAHAAANLINPRVSKELEVYAAFETMSPPRRTEIVGKLAPRLWEMARVEDEMQLPSASQVIGKDALVKVRGWADPATKAQIDKYLIDWYCVISYEKRAELGATLGAAAMRIVGPEAGKRLVSVGNRVIGQGGQEVHKVRVADELMLGLAATGDPEAVKFDLDMAKLDRGDASQGTRALSALYQAYVDPAGLFPVQTPDALGPNLDAITALAKDDTQPPKVTNDAVALIRAAGAPACLAPLVGMVAAPHHDARFKYVAANNALKCGGAPAVLEVVRALPDGGAYEKEALTGAVSGEIAKLSPREKVLASLRELLGDKATVSKWVAIEALAAMKSTEDAPRIAALAKNKEKLIGYWGEDSDGKVTPSLGDRAKELADGLGGK